MRRMTMIFAVMLAASLPAVAEEIVMKDGTKIVGHMTGMTTDKIEVETSYGKMQLNRTDIVTISFPENGTAKSAEAAPAKMELPKIDETLAGTQYTNRTGKFSLTVPTDWVIEASLRHSPDTLAALSSRDHMRYLMVIQEEYPGSLESYKQMTMLNARRNLSNFEELSQTTVTIDGKPAILVFYRGVLTTKSSNTLPVEFVSAIIQSGNSFTKLSAWCVEPLFHDMQPSFEKMLHSYRGSGRMTAASDAARP